MNLSPTGHPHKLVRSKMEWLSVQRAYKASSIKQRVCVKSPTNKVFKISIAGFPSPITSHIFGSDESLLFGGCCIVGFSCISDLNPQDANNNIPPVFCLQPKKGSLGDQNHSPLRLWNAMASEKTVYYRTTLVFCNSQRPETQFSMDKLLTCKTHNILKVKHKFWGLWRIIFNIFRDLIQLKI